MIEGLRDRRVMVIDDDATQGAALASLLRDEGIAAAFEEGAARALERMLIEPPDAVVIDVKMPELWGTELFAALRARHPRLPAVFVTGFEQHHPRLREVLDGAQVGYVGKPVEMARLLDVLARSMGLH